MSGIQLRYDKRLNVSHPPRRNISDIIMKQRRIFGGEILSTKQKSFVFLKRLLPPVNKWKRIIISDSIPARYKLSLFGFAWFLNLIFIIEFLRLELGFVAERR